ncbi:MAG: hypothetical protein GY801_08330 [bacterium]|nr:hypothetical protein [bacterium]
MALNAVRADMNAQDIDEAICSGNIVGFGPQPSESVAAIMASQWPTVAGLYDWSAAQKFSPLTAWLVFHTHLRKARDFNHHMLDESHRHFLRQLPTTISTPTFIVKQHMLLSSLALTKENDSLMQEFDMLFSELKETGKSAAFLGGMPFPFILLDTPSKRTMRFAPLPYDYTLDPRIPTIISVGSVGIPTPELSAKATYVIYNTSTHHVEMRNIDYDITPVVQQVKQKKLPEPFVSYFSPEAYASFIEEAILEF